jgi:hypothetical protein
MEYVICDSSNNSVAINQQNNGSENPFHRKAGGD